MPIRPSVGIVISESWKANKRVIRYINRAHVFQHKLPGTSYLMYVFYKYSGHDQLNYSTGVWISYWMGDFLNM